ncbi:alpha/beta hydrolase family protein, partial [Singulisphaera rosea]
MSTLSQSSRLVITLAGVLALGLSTEARSQDAGAPIARRYTASDFPQLAKGIDLPQAGTYTLKAWAPANQRWLLTTEGETVTLTSRVEGDAPTPHWQTIGEVAVGSSGRLKIVVAPKAKDASPTTSAETKPKAPEAVPALIVITSEASFDPSKGLDVARGQLDSVAPPTDARRTFVRTNREGADFHPPATAQAWQERARSLRQQLLVTLGLWPMFPKTPLHPRVFDKIERDGYTIEKVVLETFPGFTLSGNLYRPIGKTGRLPGILSPHGHYAVGRVEPDVQHRCIRWAKLGCVVFMYDMVGYNDSKSFGHAFLNDRLRRWGLSLVTLQTWNSIRALDWLTTLPDVDPARIGCTGESGGGTQTFLLTAIDDRVKVAAPAVMVSDSFQGGCTCENAAGLRIGTDNVEFAALMAPRPMKLVGATGDWTAKTMSNAYPTIRQVYSLVGSPERISADVFNFGHNYNQTSRNAVYPFMAYWLLGIDDAASTKEGIQQPEKPETLWTYDASHPGPADAKTPAQLESDLIKALGQELASLAPGEDPARWEAARRLLLASLKVRVGLVNPAPADLDATEVRRSSREGLTIIHSKVGRKGLGESIPVVRLIPAKASGRLTVIANPHGKERLTTADGGLSPMVKALIERGQSVVGFDPLFVGESMDPSSPASRRPDTVHYDTYNASLAADQLQDLATVLAWARAQ